MSIILRGGTVVGEGGRHKADLVIEHGKIAGEEEHASLCGAEIIDISGCYILPGLIDTHVHFREPGNEAAATIFSESRAAACGGVTTFFDMPNNTPPCTSAQMIERKRCIARRDSLVNYSFYLGATRSNIDEIKKADGRRVCAVKLFMGASTGDMEVTDADSIYDVFASSLLPVVTHSEDMGIIKANASRIRKRYGEDAEVKWHSAIRSVDSCYASSSLAVKIARATGASLHVAHISSERELSLFTPGDTQITAEACIPHLVFCDEDYASKGAMIKCNPALKAATDRAALRKALRAGGPILTVGTDHAPHLLAAKRGGAFKAASGMPSVQFSLINLLRLSDEGYITLEDIARLTAHAPASRFNVHGRGFIRKGYFADLAVIRPCGEYTLSKNDVMSKCGWTPYEGITYKWRVEHTFSNGEEVYSHRGGLATRASAQELVFDR